MDKLVLLAGFVGTLTSVAAVGIFSEISVACWAPERAGARWRALVNLPKLRYFWPVFRWLMPLFICISALQLLVCVKLLLAAVGLG